MNRWAGWWCSAGCGWRDQSAHFERTVGDHCPSCRRGIVVDSETAARTGAKCCHGTVACPGQGDKHWCEFSPEEDPIVEITNNIRCSFGHLTVSAPMKLLVLYEEREDQRKEAHRIADAALGLAGRAVKELDEAKELLRRAKNPLENRHLLEVQIDRFLGKGR